MPKHPPRSVRIDLETWARLRALALASRVDIAGIIGELLDLWDMYTEEQEVTRGELTP